MLAGESQLRVVATAGTVEEVLAGSAGAPGGADGTGGDAGSAQDGASADVVLLDLNLADGSTPRDNVARLRAAGAAVIVYSQLTDDALVREALVAGAAGVVDKGAGVADVVEGIIAASRGQQLLTAEWAAVLEGAHDTDRPMLSEREREALGLYASGLPMKSAARRMGISLGSFREYLLRVRRKYAEVDRPAGTKLELYRRAVEDGYDVPSATDAGSRGDLAAAGGTGGPGDADASPPATAGDGRADQGGANQGGAGSGGSGTGRRPSGPAGAGGPAVGPG